MQREKQVHLIEVHVAAMCFNQARGNTRLLIGQRADDREIFPGYWECGGGQVHVGETFNEAVLFHMNEEFGLEVNVLFPFGTYRIDLKDKMIPGIRFICEPTSSTNITIDMEEIVEYRWIDPNDASKYNMIPGLCNDIALGYHHYKRIVEHNNRIQRTHNHAEYI